MASDVINQDAVMRPLQKPSNGFRAFGSGEYPEVPGGRGAPRDGGSSAPAPYPVLCVSSMWQFLNCILYNKSVVTVSKIFQSFVGCCSKEVRMGDLQVVGEDWSIYGREILARQLKRWDWGGGGGPVNSPLPEALLFTVLNSK